MNGNDLREWYGQPLRTRERAALEVARKYLRAIVQQAQEPGDGAIRAAAGAALAEIAQALGERQ